MCRAGEIACYKHQWLGEYRVDTPTTVLKPEPLILVVAIANMQVTRWITYLTVPIQIGVEVSCVAPNL